MAQHLRRLVEADHTVGAIRCRPATEMKPRHRRGSSRDNLKTKTVLRDVSFEMTPLAAAIIDAQQLDGVALHAVHLIPKVALQVDW